MEHTVQNTEFSRFVFKQRAAGFTLIEMMIVVVIAAILASIAIPSYQAQIRKSRRTDAKTAVLDLAGREEKYFSLNNTYTNSAANLGYTSFPQTVGSGYYRLYVCVDATAGTTSAIETCTAAAATASGSSYRVSAVAAPGSSQLADSPCQYFATDNTGSQFSSSTVGIGTNTTSTCWQ